MKIFHVVRGTVALSIIFFLIITQAHAQVTAGIDNEKIQRYNNRTGIWVRCDSQASLKYYMKKYSASRSEVIEGSAAGYYFIPFSSKYTKFMDEKGITREIAPVSASGFIWPIHGTSTISSTFGMRHGKLHAGFDIPAVTGTPIIASRDGRVLSTGYSGGYGLSVIVEHRNGFITRYSHCSAILIKKGDFVRSGQVIAFVGSTGHSTGSHLDFEIRFRGVPLNPLDYMPENRNIRITHRSKDLN